jgi:hypothetical protein
LNIRAGRASNGCLNGSFIARRGLRDAFFEQNTRNAQARRARFFVNPRIERQLAFGSNSKYQVIMSVIGTVKNGVIVLPPGTTLPEGAEVKVETIQLTGNEDPFVAAAERVAKPRPHWPKDFVLNHGHYVSGEPKKS